MTLDEIDACRKALAILAAHMNGDTDARDAEILAIGEVTQIATAFTHLAMYLNAQLAGTLGVTQPEMIEKVGAALAYEEAANDPPG